MVVIHLPYIGFNCQYNAFQVDTAEIRYKDNSITFVKDDKRWTIYLSGKAKFEPYQEQYGITISNNCFFLQSWEKGLFCYHIITGELLWQTRICHAGELFLSEQNYVICFFENYGVAKIDIETGEIIQLFKTSASPCCFWEIGVNRYLLGPIGKKYRILGKDLMTICEIKSNAINPNQFVTCIIHHASLTGNMLNLEITEYSNEMLPYLQLSNDIPERITRTIYLSLPNNS